MNALLPDAPPIAARDSRTVNLRRDVHKVLKRAADDEEKKLIDYLPTVVEAGLKALGKWQDPAPPKGKPRRSRA
jgi:hypothetical protein